MMADFASLSAFLYDGVVIGVFGTPLLFALFCALPVTLIIMIKIGIPFNVSLVILAFMGLSLAIGNFVSNPTSIAYLPGWIYAIIILLVGYILWRVLWGHLR